MRLLAICIMFTLLPLPLPADQFVDLQDVNQLLQEELKLSRKAQLYLIIDLKDARCRIKASGVTVKELTILQSFTLGAFPEIKTRRVDNKNSFLSPRRPAVKVIDKNKKNDPLPAMGTLNALELHDMPGNYRLVLDNGTHIVVRSETKGFWAGFGRCWQDVWGHVSRAFKKLWSTLSGIPYTEVIITLSFEDSQQLYWTLNPGTPCLISPPRRQAE